MSEPITITVKGDVELQRAMKNLGSNLPSALESGMRSVVLYLQGWIVKEKLSGNPLERRTGNLSSKTHGIITSVRREGQVGLVGVVGTNVKYARIHEFGGIIRPKNGPYLVIPIRKGSREAIYLGLNKYKAGPKKGQEKKRIANSSDIIAFLKVRQVKIPARPFMAPAITENVGKISDIFRGVLIKLAEVVKNDAR